MKIEFARPELRLVDPAEARNVGRSGVLACQHRYVGDVRDAWKNCYAPVAVSFGVEGFADVGSLAGSRQRAQDVWPDAVRQNDYREFYAAICLQYLRPCTPSVVVTV